VGLVPWRSLGLPSTVRHSLVFSAGFGFGVGWFPLGFGEPFNPWFRCGRGFVERINVRNTFIRNARDI
jgi:hypothetical protein